MNYSKRQHKLIELLDTKSVDAFIIKKKQNISYLVGTQGEDAILFISHKKKILITDARYKEEYEGSLKNCSIRVARGPADLFSVLKRVSKECGSRRIGFESNRFSYSEYTDLKRHLQSLIFVPLKGIVESLRIIKDKDEIKCIKKACKDGSQIMDYGLRIARPSLSENTVKNRIEAHIKKNNLKRADFEIIVASGKNASRPHAAASGKRIKKQEMVVIDLGAKNYGYNSDLTRTVFLGRINRKYFTIYNIVSDAQKKVIEHIKPGVRTQDMDSISRDYISKNRLGKYFIHSLGHGIGLETHEAPYISRDGKVLLKENMVFTIEPGVYIPGWGGVRIEDVVRVTKNGCRVLTNTCKKIDL